MVIMLIKTNEHDFDITLASTTIYGNWKWYGSLVAVSMALFRLMHFSRMVTHTYMTTVLISFELFTGAFLTPALLIKLIQTPMSAFLDDGELPPQGSCYILFTSSF